MRSYMRFQIAEECKMLAAFVALELTFGRMDAELMIAQARRLRECLRALGTFERTFACK